MTKKVIELNKSDFIESFLQLNGQPVSLDLYPHMRTIIDTTPNRNVVMQFGRQTTKSTTMANVMVANAVLMGKDPNTGVPGGFSQMYISPSVDQTRIFSRDRLAEPFESPFMKKYYLNSNLVQNIFSKELLNNARIYLRYARENADRLRGVSADAIYYDEVQDLNMDIIPVVNQAMSRSYHKWNIFSGTPKRTQGILSLLYNKSTKNEWMPRCTHCGKWNYLDEENIGKHGLICRYCGKPLDPNTGQWVRTNESDVNNYYEGFRVSQLQFYGAPWVEWEKDIVAQYESQPRNLFFNEVLGLPYDEGTTPITKKDIKACCSTEPMRHQPTNKDRSYRNYIGLDYGPANSRNSYTVLSVVQQRGDKLHVVYMKKYKGKERAYSFIHDDVPRIMKRWNAVLIGADYGMGEAANSEIRSRIGFEKLIAYQHLGIQKARTKWNKDMIAYTLSKNQTVSEFFQSIRSRQIVFPRWSQFKDFAVDLLAVYIEYDEEKGTYKFVNDKPDDSLHAILYGKLASELGELVY